MRSVIGMPSPLTTRRLTLAVLCGVTACKTSHPEPAETAPQEIVAATEPGVGTPANDAAPVEHRAWRRSPKKLWRPCRPNPATY